MAIPLSRSAIDYSQQITYNSKSKILNSQLSLSFVVAVANLLLLRRMEMFTGLIQQVCSVKALSKSGDTAALTVDLDQLANQVKIGDSIAINGACLTISKLSGTLATFDLSSETLAKTNLSKLSPGSMVNIELAMTPTDRFGGHFVLGHVDGIATIRKIEKKAGSTSSPQGDYAVFTFAAPKELLGQMVPLGSVAVDGVSLTVISLGPECFTVALIPLTLQHTTLGQAKINQQVNVETDIIVKTTKRHLEKLSPKNGLTIEDLRQQGF
jgi:riboflavin synthase